MYVRMHACMHSGIFAGSKFYWFLKLDVSRLFFWKENTLGCRLKFEIAIEFWQEENSVALDLAEITLENMSLIFKNVFQKYGTIFIRKINF